MSSTGEEKEVNHVVHSSYPRKKKEDFLGISQDIWNTLFALGGAAGLLGLGIVGYDKFQGLMRAQQEAMQMQQQQQQQQESDQQQQQQQEPATVQPPPQQSKVIVEDTITKVKVPPKSAMPPADSMVDEIDVEATERKKRRFQSSPFGRDINIG